LQETLFSKCFMRGKMKIVYDQKLMSYIILFENLTNVKVKDVYERGDSMWFVIEKGGFYKVVGKNGSKIKRIENLMKRKIRVIEFDEICKFSSNLIYPVKAEKIEFEERKLNITVPDTKSKALLIGRERRNLKELKEVLKRYFDIEDIIIK